MIRDAVAAAPGTAAAYRCLVRVVACTPPADAIARACIPARLAGDAALQERYTDPDAWVFALQLRLEDGSGCLEARLFGRAADEFFRGVAPPQDLTESEAARVALQDAVSHMLGVECADVRGVWMEVCLAAYWPETGGGDGGVAPQRSYRIFATQLKARPPPQQPAA